MWYKSIIASHLGRHIPLLFMNRLSKTEFGIFISYVILRYYRIAPGTAYTTTVHEQTQWNRVWYIHILNCIKVLSHHTWDGIHHYCSWTDSVKQRLAYSYLVWYKSIIASHLGPHIPLVFMNRLSETEIGIFISCVILEYYRITPGTAYTNTVHEKTQ